MTGGSPTASFEQLHQLVLEAYDNAGGFDLENLVVDGCIAKSPGGGQNTGRNPVDRGKSGLKRSARVDGEGLPSGWILAGSTRNDLPLLRPTRETLRLFGGRLPPAITVHLDAVYGPTRGMPARPDACPVRTIS